MAKFKVGDKVKILDGSKIKDYAGGWASNMWKFVGDTVTISEVIAGIFGKEICYRMKEIPHTWDERGLKSTQDKPRITIDVYGSKTVAKLYKDGKVVKTGVAKCSPNDEFDFNLGATIALSRVTGLEKKVEEEKPKFKVGDFVKVISVSSPNHAFPIGTIVEVKAGPDIDGDLTCYGLCIWGNTRIFSTQFISLEDVEKC